MCIHFKWRVTKELKEQKNWIICRFVHSLFVLLLAVYMSHLQKDIHRLLIPITFASPPHNVMCVCVVEAGRTCEMRRMFRIGPSPLISVSQNCHGLPANSSTLSFPDTDRHARNRVTEGEMNEKAIKRGKWTKLLGLFVTSCLIWQVQCIIDTMCSLVCELHRFAMCARHKSLT